MASIEKKKKKNIDGFATQDAIDRSTRYIHFSGRLGATSPGCSSYPAFYILYWENARKNV